MRGRVGAPCDPLYYNIDRDADLVVQVETFKGNHTCGLATRASLLYLS